MSRQLAQGHATSKQWSWDLNSGLGLFLYSIQVSITTLPWRLSHESRRRWKVRESWRGKKVKFFWSFPAQQGKHCCSYQVIEVSMCCCQKGWMNLFPLAYMWLLRERHSHSFQVKKLSGSRGSSSIEATLLTCKINVTEAFAYVTASDTVWSLHKRDIYHLTGLRLGKTVEASPSFLAQMSVNSASLVCFHCKIRLPMGPLLVLWRLWITVPAPDEFEEQT